MQEYRGTKTKYEVKFWKSPFPVDTSFEKELFIDKTLVGEEIKILNHMEDPSINELVDSCTSMSKYAMTFNTLLCT